MADRTTSNQTKHDKEVKSIADDYKDKGYIVAFSFTKGAIEEAVRAKKDGLHIDLLFNS